MSAEVLDRHRAHLEDELGRHERMLAFLGRLIERKEGVMPYGVQVKDVPTQHVAAVRKHVSMATIGAQIMEGFNELGATMGRTELQMAGPRSS